MNLNELKKEAAQCKLCELHHNRLKPVFGKWNENADVVVCGMCPGPDENVAGLPFVGRSGKLLDQIISSSNFGAASTSKIYITNLVKCFLKPGIKLDTVWIENCLPYFILQLQIIKPKLIIGLGGDVCNFLLNNDWAVKAMREKTFKYLNYDLICSYHPSFFVRKGGSSHPDFYKALEDFNFAYHILYQKGG
jgi:Uracil-DNA glycosylase